MNTLSFILQVNDAGAWRNVVRGNADQMEKVTHLASLIAITVGAGYKWRVVNGISHEVIGYCRAPDFEWIKVH